MLLGAHFPTLVNGVITGVPSSVANLSFPERDGAAWTLAGKPVPTVSTGEQGNPQPRKADAVISVERIA